MTTAEAYRHGVASGRKLLAAARDLGTPIILSYQRHRGGTVVKIAILDDKGTVVESLSLEDYVAELREYDDGSATEEDLRRWAWDAMTDEVQAAGSRLLEKGANDVI
jgi:hypothetical protein